MEIAEERAWDTQDADRWRAAWQGRVSKGYTLMGDEWKLIMHTGVLRY